MPRTRKPKVEDEQDEQLPKPKKRGNKRHDAMSFEEMVEASSARRQNAAPYQKSDATIARECGLQQIIRADLEALGEIADFIGEGNLADTDWVLNRLALYYRACEEGGVMPSMMGFASSMGYSYDALQRFRKEHPHHKTTKLLELLKDRLAVLLWTAGSKDYLNIAAVIFALKSMYNWQESIVIEAKAAEDPLGEVQSNEQIAERYRYLAENNAVETY